MAKGRPGGNPDLEKHQFTTEREEPCTAKLTLRVPPSQYEKLKQLPKWQEKVREAIASLLELELEQGQLDSTATENAVTTKPAAGTTGDGGQAPTDGTGERTQEDKARDTRTKSKSKRSPSPRSET